MRRLLALASALLALLAAGLLWTRDRPVAVAFQPMPTENRVSDDEVDTRLIAPASAVTPEQREARRFARYDRNKDLDVSRDEYLASRQKAFAKLDRNSDGQLSFEEHAAATVKKFDAADRDANGKLKPAEFATTAAKRRTTPACECS